MVSVHSFVAAAEETDQALKSLSVQCAGLRDQVSFACIFYDERHDDRLIHAFLEDHFAGVPVIGGTSCGGAMSAQGLGGEGSIGLLAVIDPNGEYGVATASLQGDIASVAEATLHRALANANCPGELPELVWVYQAPGQEELVIEGLRRVVGDRCPIIGGSSADNTVAGRWRQLGPDGPMAHGLVVAVLFSSGGISFAFQGGYEPAGPSGVVTKVAYEPLGSSGVVTSARGRTIVSIDGEPAAQVYNRWTQGAVAEKLGGGNILMETTMHPLGIDVGKIGDVPHYLVVHPDQVLADGSLCTFADIAEGTTLFSMRGDKTRLVERAGKVAPAAANGLSGGPESLAGGLVVYCAGCRLAVDDQMDEVATTIAESFDGSPFIGCFTFGEQGQVLGHNAHGNLMISAIAFGR